MRIALSSNAMMRSVFVIMLAGLVAFQAVPQASRKASTPFVQQTGDEILNNYVAAVAATQSGRSEYSNALAALGIDACIYADQLSGNTEMDTAEMRGGSPDYNLRETIAQGYARTSIVQFECGPHAPPKPAGVGGRGFSTFQTPTSTTANLTPGYAVMVRMKGKFAESIAPRPLTVLPGYGAARAAALQQTGTESFRKDMAEESRKAQQNQPSWIPPSSVDLKALQGMSPAEMQQAFEKSGEQMRVQMQQNLANMTPAQQQQAMIELARNFNQLTSSPAYSTLNQSGAMPGINAPPNGETVEPLAFLNMLRRGEALVDAYKFRVREGNRFGPEHYLLAVSRNLSSRRFVDIGPAAPIDSAIEDFFRIAAPQSAPDIRGVRPRVAESSSSGSIQERWRALQQLVARPILDALPPGADRLWFSPDSSLGLAPLSSLFLSMGSPVVVAITPSAYDFVRLRSTPPSLAPARALLVGDLDFGQGDQFRSLAGTRREVTDLAGIASGAQLQVVTLRGTQATRTAVINGIENSRYAHLATHGFLHPSSSPDATALFRSAGIALSSANGRSPDSLLTANDIRQLDLTRTQLITLSACDTGAGKAVEGQGLLGFQTALMAAGARSVLLSLWPAPDDATALLMKAFYEGLWRAQPMTQADALRHAQQVVLSNPDFANPLNWAGWVLIGESW